MLEREVDDIREKIQAIDIPEGVTVVFGIAAGGDMVTGHGGTMNPFTMMALCVSVSQRVAEQFFGPPHEVGGEDGHA